MLGVPVVVVFRTVSFGCVDDLWQNLLQRVNFGLCGHIGFFDVG